MNDPSSEQPAAPPSLIHRIIRFFLERKIVVFLLIGIVIIGGIAVAPFDWHVPGLPRAAVPVDAIPDTGENQQIVFTKWPGRSPQDVDDQITYPLTSALLGVPKVKTIRSVSMFGFSSIYVIFEESAGFYWARTRVLEKLNSLAPDTLPQGVMPMLGPDATALGQVFWYTLEGRDKHGNPTGGWDLHELRSIQDWNVRYALMSVKGVSEVASVGGFVKEYQIDVDPDAMRAHDVTLDEVVAAVRRSNVDVGARTIEVNKVEYVVRGLGFIKSLADIENAVVKVNDNVPIYVKNVATVGLGPALRRGALDKGGAEVVGGVVVVRYGENPLATIKRVKQRIEQISGGLPKRTLPDGTVSQVRLVPFYDRTGLIYETLGTLRSALWDEILVTIIVVLVMVVHLRSSALISGLLPMAVLMCFIAMKVFHVDANIVALSGIAIAIGTIVDMGIIVCENILRHLDQAGPDERRLEVIYRAASEVGGAVVTAVSTTVISFLPVFTMVAAEGKLFRPLAFTKTFALAASIIVALTILPALAHILFVKGPSSRRVRTVLYGGIVAAGILVGVLAAWWAGLLIALIGLVHLGERSVPKLAGKWAAWITVGIIVAAVAILLTRHWVPLGVERGLVLNLVFVSVLIAAFLVLFMLFRRGYGRMLTWCLNHKAAFLTIPLVLILLGTMVWLGFDRIFGWLPRSVRTSRPVSAVAHAFPGLGREFMPPLDEGSFLWMPSLMPHGSIGEALDVVQQHDRAIAAIPEVESVVGKIGRADTPLDPAPIGMIEAIINYKSEYKSDESGRPIRYRYVADENDLFRNEAGDPQPAADGEPYYVKGRFVRDENNALIADRHGRPFRVWRPPLDPELNEGRQAWPGIQSPDDIWQAIRDAAETPWTTPVTKLQPIETRRIMLQSGIRGRMAVRIKGPDQETIQRVAFDVERLLKDMPGIVDAATVNVDRIVGKPYLEIVIDREALRYKRIDVQHVQDVIETAIGGRPITTTVEGRQRYPVRVRYMRELRDTIEDLEKTLVPAADGTQVPLGQLATITHERGPEMIKSEDTFLVGYVVFDGAPGLAAVNVIEQVEAHLDNNLDRPSGVTIEFAGEYENQVRAARTLSVVLPVALFAIFLILYFQFKSVPTTFLVFSGIAVAWAGGFILIWLYAQPWFLNFPVFGVNMRALFQVHTVNLSVAVWVGFLALFGIASDNGVVIATYLNQSFARRKPTTAGEVRSATLEASLRRIRPALMTSATTILALIPVLTSTGRGADVMVPMAIPSFGGMLFALITVFVVPVLYCAIEEGKLKRRRARVHHEDLQHRR